MNYDVFLSYARKDQVFADGLCHQLEQKGVRCWIDHRDLPTGSNWAEEIDEAIKGNPGLALVLIFSSAANSSTEIIKELGLASRYKIPVLPIRIENVEPSGGYSYHLQSTNWLNAFSEDQFKNLENISENIKRSVLIFRERKQKSMEESAKKETPIVLQGTQIQTDEKKSPFDEQNLNWPQIGRNFLKEVQKALDISQLPFKPTKVSAEEDIEDSDPIELDWSVTDKYYFAVWFDNKREQKVDMKWGYYSKYEKRDPVFRQTYDDISEIQDLLNKDGEVSINEYIYYFNSEDYLGFETKSGIDISKLNDSNFAKHISDQIISLSQKIWPSIKMNIFDWLTDKIYLAIKNSADQLPYGKDNWQIDKYDDNTGVFVIPKNYYDSENEVGLYFGIENIDRKHLYAQKEQEGPWAYLYYDAPERRSAKFKNWEEEIKNLVKKEKENIRAHGYFEGAEPDDEQYLVVRYLLNDLNIKKLKTDADKVINELVPIFLKFINDNAYLLKEFPK